MARAPQPPSGPEAATLSIRKLFLSGRFEPALAQLIEVVERDRSFAQDAGRRTMLSVFELAAQQPQLVSTYRKRLAAVLNR